MFRNLRSYALFVLGLSFLFSAEPGRAQLGNSGSIEGVVKDPSGAAVANATVVAVPEEKYRKLRTPSAASSGRPPRAPMAHSASPMCRSTPITWW